MVKIENLSEILNHESQTFSQQRATPITMG